MIKWRHKCRNWMFSSFNARHVRIASIWGLQQRLFSSFFFLFFTENICSFIASFFKDMTRRLCINGLWWKLLLYNYHRGIIKIRLRHASTSGDQRRKVILSSRAIWPIHQISTVLRILMISRTSLSLPADNPANYVTISKPEDSASPFRRSSSNLHPSSPTFAHVHHPGKSEPEVEQETGGTIHQKLFQRPRNKSSFSTKLRYTVPKGSRFAAARREYLFTPIVRELINEFDRAPIQGWNP